MKNEIKSHQTSRWGGRREKRIRGRHGSTRRKSHKVQRTVSIESIYLFLLSTTREIRTASDFDSLKRALRGRSREKKWNEFFAYILIVVESDWSQLDNNKLTYREKFWNESHERLLLGRNMLRAKHTKTWTQEKEKNKNIVNFFSNVDPAHSHA